MKNIYSLVLACLLAGSIFAQKKEEVKTVDGAMDDMMKKWTEMAAPNENHKLLDAFVGTWDAVTTMWMQGPD